MLWTISKKRFIIYIALPAGDKSGAMHLLLIKNKIIDLIRVYLSIRFKIYGTVG